MHVRSEGLDIALSCPSLGMPGEEFRDADMVLICVAISTKAGFLHHVLHVLLCREIYHMAEVYSGQSVKLLHNKRLVAI